LNLNGIISEMLKMLGRLIGENVRITWLPGENLGLIRIDPSQIDQMLANLCVNASDAIDGAGTITIETANTTFREEDCFVHSEYQFIPGDYVVLAVSDDGVGMDSETLKRVFEPFFTTKKAGQGTGLGMATVYGIVKQNKGFVNVYSEPGKGTTVRVYLPRTDIPETDSISPANRHLFYSGGETVLVVEDEPAILRLAVTMLERLGYRVLEASGPAEAARVSENCNEKIDLLITDVIMPGMDGKKLSQLLTAKYPLLKTVFMSGYTANVIVHQGELDQSVTFLQKPFSFEELSQKVRAALGQNH
jgi:CheY-like chemotaxis protein